MKRYRVLVEQLEDKQLRTGTEETKLRIQAAKAIRGLVEEIRLRDEIEALIEE